MKTTNTNKKKELIKPFYFFLKLLTGLFLLIALGTIVYMLIEKWDFYDSLFMSVTTITTVGYGIVNPPLSRAGELFTIFYLLFGVILFLYFAALTAEYIILVNFGKLLSIKKMESKLKKIKNHYIVCGYGRTGAEIVSQLISNKLNFVIIDNNNENIETLNDLGYLYVTGDATDDIILEKAGIKEAKGIFCSLCNDVDNLYLTLSSKNLNPKLTIVARCIKSSNEQKFSKAGANKIILPYEICGRRMVSSVIKPLVVDFLDVVVHTQGQDLELKLEQYELNKGSALENETILSSEIRQKTGVIVIAIKRADDYITNPSADTMFKIGDFLIVLGTNSQLNTFEKLFT